MTYTKTTPQPDFMAIFCMSGVPPDVERQRGMPKNSKQALFANCDFLTFQEMNPEPARIFDFLEIDTKLVRTIFV